MRRYFIGSKKMFSVCMFFLIFTALSSFAAENTLLLATTTSTDNTGLLDYLAPKFTQATDIKLKWVATGTGKALKLGENCDVDVLMVHAPSAEKTFVDAGFGIHRRQIMLNDFVFIGPGSDPAEIKGKSVCTALKTIQEKKEKFASRGDNSGTNKKEISLWKQCIGGVPEKERWYLQTGQGMLATINVTAEQGGYTLTDRGTYIKYEADHKGNQLLQLLVEGDATLKNQYSIIEVNPKRCRKVKNDQARKLGEWLLSPEGQKAIGDFRLLGKQLFEPNEHKK